MTMFQTRVYQYDDSLAYLQPPWFPTLDDAFTVGSTLTVPLHAHTSPDAVAAIHDVDLAASSISTRRPTLDDVYLQLTGARLADAA